MKLKGPAKGIEPPHPDEVVFDSQRFQTRQRARSGHSPYV